MGENVSLKVNKKQSKGKQTSQMGRTWASLRNLGIPVSSIYPWPPKHSRPSDVFDTAFLGLESIQIPILVFINRIFNFIMPRKKILKKDLIPTFAVNILATGIINLNNNRSFSLIEPLSSCPCL